MFTNFVLYRFTDFYMKVNVIQVIHVFFSKELKGDSHSKSLKTAFLGAFYTVLFPLKKKIPQILTNSWWTRWDS